jgi:multiple sugar transport system substrate-binding protein
MMDQQQISRRRFLGLMATAGGASILAACGAAPSSPQASGDTTAPATGAGVPNEIDYFTYDLGPANASREEAITRFQELNPGATVKLTVLPYEELFQKVAAQMAAGQPPDVIYGDFSLLRYALDGNLLDLSDRVAADPVLSSSDLFTVDLADPIQAKYGTDKIVALLLGTWVPLLYYNRDLFDSAGVAYPSDDWTWDDVRSTALQLTNAEAGQYGFQFGSTYDFTGWTWWQHQPSDYWALPQVYPKETNWTTDAGRGVMQLIHNLSVVDKSAIPSEETNSYEVYAGGFGAGVVGMYAGGDWDAGWAFREAPFNWDVVLLPAVTKEFRPALNTMVASNVVSAQTKNPDLAWEFVRFLSADEEGQTLIGSGAFETPILKTVAQSDAIARPDWAPPGYDARVRAALLPGPMYTPYPLTLNLWEFPEKFLNPTVLNVRNGEMSPDDALAYLDKEGNAYFQQQQQ